MPLAPPLAVAGAVYDDIVGAYRGFMPSRTRAFLVIHHGPLEPQVRCPYCGRPRLEHDRRGARPPLLLFLQRRRAKRRLRLQPQRRRVIRRR
ncbi:hypothetical protein OsJ_20922 [Oryza sativa Japonica Group]|uniref:Uncharacterized protein n=1 Tax=Oryza sativa subsp. japonica TaxID=39947 RepID=B9FSN3_ORYSJ|nr:hypothetical protein OsJ_20922 [Oryza sativa Japonica Group]